MDAEDLTVGQSIVVDLGEIRGRKEARVVRVPPFTENVAGKERRVTDQVKVEYPNTSPGSLIGNLRENVDLEAVVE